MLAALPLRSDPIKQSLISSELQSRLGLSPITERSFYKQIDYRFGFNYCTILVTGSNYLSISVGKVDKDYERQILKLLYIPNEQFLIDILSKLVLLRNIFPEIVLVPQSDIIV